MRNAECFVEVQVGDVGPVIARTTKADLGVHVGSVKKDLKINSNDDNNLNICTYNVIK